MAFNAISKEADISSNNEIDGLDEDVTKVCFGSDVDRINGDSLSVKMNNHQFQNGDHGSQSIGNNECIFGAGGDPTNKISSSDVAQKLASADQEEGTSDLCAVIKKLSENCLSHDDDTIDNPIDEELCEAAATKLPFELYNKVCAEVEQKEPLDESLHRVSQGIDDDNDDDDDDDESQDIPLQDIVPLHNKLHHGETLEWFDNQHQEDTIHRLNVFRKSRKFCDLVLLVAGHDFYCHRVVVGGASRAIYDELCRGEQESGPIARIPVDVSKPGLVPEAIEILLNYMYTSKLSFATEHLTNVYRAALQLGVERVIPICRRHVQAAVDAEQCIHVRRLAQNYGDLEMKRSMDHFIEANFEVVSGCNEFLALPRINIEVIVSPNPSVVNLLSISPKDGLLSQTAMLWISYIIQTKGGNYLEDLTEQIQRIPLEELDNAASCSRNGQNGSHLRAKPIDSEHHRKLSGEGGYVPWNRWKRSSSMDSIKSSDSNDSMTRVKCNPDGEWNVIASIQVADSDHMISLCCLGDLLCVLSIRLPVQPVHNGEMPNGHDLCYHASQQLSSISSSSASCSSSVGSNFQFCPMNQPRSAAGVAQIDGKIIATGGFNQSESLDTVECFDVSLNRWSSLARMNEKRGRFSVAILDGELYAVGGSTGSHDLNSVERYNIAQDSWTRVQPLPFGCSAIGVAVLNGVLYCVGGVRQRIGIAGLKACQAYDPKSDRWEYRASMHTARCSLGVAALGGHVYAVAGSDGYRCLNSAERYDPITNLWSFIAPLKINRRGLGLVEHNGALYCVGGSDGQSFLSSVERYHPIDGDVWTLTSFTLSVPRNNAGLASLNGNVFVVGGFSGRLFLSSVEVIEDGALEWSSHDSVSSRSVASETKESE